MRTLIFILGLGLSAIQSYTQTNSLNPLTINDQDLSIHVEVDTFQKDTTIRIYLNNISQNSIGIDTSIGDNTWTGQRLSYTLGIDYSYSEILTFHEVKPGNSIKCNLNTERCPRTIDFQILYLKNFRKLNPYSSAISLTMDQIDKKHLGILRRDNIRLLHTKATNKSN